MFNTGDDELDLSIEETGIRHVFHPEDVLALLSGLGVPVKGGFSGLIGGREVLHLEKRAHGGVANKIHGKGGSG